MSLHKKTSKLKQSPSAPVVEDQPVEKTKRTGCRGLLMRWLVKVSLVLLLLAIVVPFGFYISQPKYYTILLIGSDQRGTEHARSDALIVVSIPKSSKHPFSMTMIPRDTKVEHSEKGLQKLTHFYAMWDDPEEYLGNKELTVEVIEDLLDIKLDGTIEVTFDSFTEIVDLLGGVDTSQGYLTGAEAKELVHNRYNKEAGDFGRGEAQREIVRNLITRIKSPSNARAVYAYMQTTDRARVDINSTSLVAFGVAYLIGHRGDVSLGEVEEVVLPGEGQRIYTPDFGKELYYWVLDETGTKEMVEQYLK